MKLFAKYSTQAEETRGTRNCGRNGLESRTPGQSHQSLALAKLWLEINPGSIKAHKAVIQSYALLRDPISALPYAVWVARKENNDEVFLAVTTMAEAGSKEQVSSLIASYQQISIAPDREHISQLAIALLLQKSDRFEEAESMIKDFLKKSRNDPRGISLLPRWIAKKIDEAQIREALQKTPSTTNYAFNMPDC